MLMNLQNQVSNDSLDRLNSNDSASWFPIDMDDVYY